MYNHIICVGDVLWDIIEDGVGFAVDAEGMVVDRKSLTEAQRKIYRKHHMWNSCGCFTSLRIHQDYG